ncbi:MAG: glycosyltransferase family 9 protein [Gloeomargaritaceae cyanobacterium C42_A2020_066]|nr:glycosyltransferase family 9 protein [Gloeomargaritaceae cyanobacterium C42_A2020_066]
MRFLALVPGGIGDQLLFFPTLADLKQAFPQAQIDVVVEPRAAGAYRLCPHVRQVMVFDFKGRNSLTEWINLLGNIREGFYDAVLALGQQWGVGFFLWLTGIPNRIGYDGPGRPFLTRAVPLKTEQYAAHLYHDLLQGLGIGTACPPLSVQLAATDVAWAEAEQTRLGILESGFLLIHGGASALSQKKGLDKLYPIPQWQAVLAGLKVQQPHLPCVLLQGPEDGAWVEALTTSHPDLRVVSPPDLGKLAALIASANLMLCTDSAPMHLGVALQTPLVALFGPTEARKLLPPTGPFRAVQSPAGRMADIEPSAILQALQS